MLFPEKAPPLLFPAILSYLCSLCRVVASKDFLLADPYVPWSPALFILCLGGSADETLRCWLLLLAGGTVSQQTFGSSSSYGRSAPLLQRSLNVWGCFVDVSTGTGLYSSVL